MSYVKKGSTRDTLPLELYNYLLVNSDLMPPSILVDSDCQVLS